jgi:hypothetical protein
VDQGMKGELGVKCTHAGILTAPGRWRVKLA